MLAEFSLTCVFHHVWETFLKFIVFTFLKNALNLGIITHVRSPCKTPGRIFGNLFPPTAAKVGENFNLLYQNSIRKCEDDLEH